MAPSPPLLTIGIPVYNGERYLGLALESLLDQSHRDFNIILSDNASTDGTLDICRDFAARDPRIRYVRNEVNIGAARNYNQVFEIASAPYFKWAAHDDLLHPEFLRKCLQVLENDPSIIGCYSKAKQIDEWGKVVGTYDDFNLRVASPFAHERFSDLVLYVHHCIAVFGVIRRDVLKKTQKIGDYVGSDRNLIAELGLLGRLYEIPEYLFFRRDHPETSVRAYDPYDRLQWFNPEKRSFIHLPTWRKGLEYFLSVWRVPIGPREKIRCCRILIRWLKKNRRLLIIDLKTAASRKSFMGRQSGLFPG